MQPAGHRGGVAEGPVRVGEAAPVAQALPGGAPLLAAAGAGDGLGCPARHGATSADSAGAGFPEVPQLAAVRAAAFQRGAGDPAMTAVAADPVTELDRCRVVEAGPVPGPAAAWTAPDGLRFWPGPRWPDSGCHRRGVHLEQVVGSALQRGAQRQQRVQLHLRACSYPNRTVDSHVRSILNKLGFNSRAQIAAWMASPDQ